MLPFGQSRNIGGWYFSEMQVKVRVRLIKRSWEQGHKLESVISYGK